MSDKTKPRNRLGDRLRAQGFDKSYSRGPGEGYHVGCSQCQAMCVNGIPIHERGCPNESRGRRRAAEEDGHGSY